MVYTPVVKLNLYLYLLVENIGKRDQLRQRILEDRQIKSK